MDIKQVKTVDRYCAGCIYRVRITDSMFFCSYIFRTGKARGCPAGKGCTKRIRRKLNG